MSLFRTLAVMGAVNLAAVFNGAVQRPKDQPSMAYGEAQISLGMTVKQVEQQLSEAERHIEILSDKVTALVYRNGESDHSEGQVTFRGGRAIYADYHMPNAHTADELAQEIAGAVDSMETKTCTISNYSAHGTGGGFSESIFECGSRRFDVMTGRTLGSSIPTINVNLEIGTVWPGQ